MLFAINFHNKRHYYVQIVLKTNPPPIETLPYPLEMSYEKYFHPPEKNFASPHRLISGTALSFTGPLYENIPLTEMLSCLKVAKKHMHV